jgi:hypothetical protein
VHTGIGPFRPESACTWRTAACPTTRSARISAFGNFPDASAPNLLGDGSRHAGAGGADAPKTQTYDFEIGNTNVLGGHHIFTYGGNVRQNN